MTARKGLIEQAAFDGLEIAFPVDGLGTGDFAFASQSINVFICQGHNVRLSSRTHCIDA